ncbi:hypothetical protein H0H92_005844, partial [Tricholoma furcatifolium]
MPSTLPNIPKLNANNYGTWQGEMEAYLRSQNAWQPVAKPELAPTLSSSPTSEEKKEMRGWVKDSDAAA